MKKNAFDLTTDVLISGLQHYRDDASDDSVPTLTGFTTAVKKGNGRTTLCRTDAGRFQRQPGLWQSLRHLLRRTGALRHLQKSAIGTVRALDAD